MSREEESGNDSAPGTPTNTEKKKKTGLKKFLSLKSKKDSNSGDKSPSASGRFERDEGEVSRSSRMRLTNIFKSSPRKSDKSVTRDITKVQGLTQETKKDGTKPAGDSKTSKEETVPIKVAGVEAIGKEPKPVEKAKVDNQNDPHKHTQIDNKAKSKEHQGPEVVAKAAEHDHQQKQVEDTKGDSKDEQPKDAAEVVEQESRDFGSPPPPPLLQEKEEVGCESIAKGLQKVCLPWTVKKEDD